MFPLSTALACVVLLLNDKGGSFQDTRTSPPFLAGSSYGPCGIPQPDPPTLPTFSAPGSDVASAPALAPLLAAALPDDSAGAAVVLPPAWPGVPLQAEMTSAVTAARAVRPTTRDFLMNNPPHGAVRPRRMNLGRSL